MILLMIMVTMVTDIIYGYSWLLWLLILLMVTMVTDITHGYYGY